MEVGVSTASIFNKAMVEDIPAMATHRAEKPNGFPFGGFVKIGPEEMQAILHLTNR